MRRRKTLDLSGVTPAQITIARPAQAGPITFADAPKLLEITVPQKPAAPVLPTISVPPKQETKAKEESMGAFASLFDYDDVDGEEKEVAVTESAAPNEIDESNLAAETKIEGVKEDTFMDKAMPTETSAITSEPTGTENSTSPKIEVEEKKVAEELPQTTPAPTIPEETPKLAPAPTVPASSALVLFSELPPDWKECADAATGDKYYWNTATGSVTWERPQTTALVKSSQADVLNQFLSELDELAQNRDGFLFSETVTATGGRETWKPEGTWMCCSKQEQLDLLEAVNAVYTQIEDETMQEVLKARFEDLQAAGGGSVEMFRSRLKETAIAWEEKGRGKREREREEARKAKEREKGETLLAEQNAKKLAAEQAALAAKYDIELAGKYAVSSYVQAQVQQAHQLAMYAAAVTVIPVGEAYPFPVSAHPLPPSGLPPVPPVSSGPVPPAHAPPAPPPLSAEKRLQILKMEEMEEGELDDDPPGDPAPQNPRTVAPTISTENEIADVEMEIDDTEEAVSVEISKETSSQPTPHPPAALAVETTVVETRVGAPTVSKVEAANTEIKSSTAEIVSISESAPTNDEASVMSTLPPGVGDIVKNTLLGFVYPEDDLNLPFVQFQFLDRELTCVRLIGCGFVACEFSDEEEAELAQNIDVPPMDPRSWVATNGGFFTRFATVNDYVQSYPIIFPESESALPPAPVAPMSNSNSNSNSSTAANVSALNYAANLASTSMQLSREAELTGDFLATQKIKDMEEVAAQNKQKEVYGGKEAEPAKQKVKVASRFQSSKAAQQFDKWKKIAEPEPVPEKKKKVEWHTGQFVTSGKSNPVGGASVTAGKRKAVEEADTPSLPLSGHAFSSFPGLAASKNEDAASAEISSAKGSWRDKLAKKK